MGNATADHDGGDGGEREGGGRRAWISALADAGAGRYIRNDRLDRGTMPFTSDPSPIAQRSAAPAVAHSGSWEWDALVATAHDIFFAIRPDGTIASLNNAFEWILGWPVADWLGKPWAPLIHPDDFERTAALVARTLQGELTRSADVRVRAQTGQYITFDYSAAPEIVAKTVVGVRGVARDVTARRSAERQLAQRAAQQEAVAQLGSDALAGREVEELRTSAVELVARMLEADSAAAARVLARHAVLTGEPLGIIDAAGRPPGVHAAASDQERPLSTDDATFVQAVANILALTIQRHRAENLRRQLLARAIDAQEDERRRVARDLHDQTGQLLSALLVGLRTAEDARTLAQTRQVLQRLRALAGDVARDVGRIARGLRPLVLDDLGLVAAIVRLAEDVAVSGGPRVRTGSTLARRLPPVVETTLYRVVQEALTNVLRHARAGAATVELSEGGAFVLAVVQDDGVGFDVPATLASGRSLGLAGMRERAALLRGSVRLESTLGVGTTVTVCLPREP